MVFSDPFPTQIMKGLERFTGDIDKWAIPLAAIGTVAMAFIQAAKNVTPIRNWFQRVRLRNWLESSIRGDYVLNRFARKYKRLHTWFRSHFQKEEKLKEEEQETKVQVRNVEQDLISLATCGDAAAFYDLAINDLCDQIRKIVPILLDYPEPHKRLLLCLARGAGREDLSLLFGEDDHESPTIHGQFDEDQKDANRKFLAAKSRILVQVRCAIDAIQTSIGYRWKFWLQLASMILSAVIGVVSLNLGALSDDKGPLSMTYKFWASVTIGLLAGFLAPVARDLVAAIEKWRS